jgi:protein TonB
MQRTHFSLHHTVPATAGAVILHVAALWALHAAFLHRTVEILVPAMARMDMVAASNFEAKVAPTLTQKAQAAPKSIAFSSPPASQPTRSAPRPALPEPTASQPSPLWTPQSVAAVAANVQAADHAARSSTMPSSSSGASNDTPGMPGLTSTAKEVVAQPSSDADYLHNPKPAYPPLSRRLGEQGTVIVRALIGTDGSAHTAEIQQSSGFTRLDQAALATTLRWRYVPGTRGAVAQAMWVNLPFSFVLE